MAEIFQSKRLIIRNFLPGDRNEFFRYRNDPAIRKFQSFELMSLEEAENFVTTMEKREFGKKGEWVQWAIEDMASGQLAGDIGLKPEIYDERIVEMGITLSPQFQKQGLAREAIRSLLVHLFSERKVHRVFAISDVDNVPSIQLLKSLDFRLEGQMKKSFFNGGSWRDELLYAILAEEVLS